MSKPICTPAKPLQNQGYHGIDGAVTCCLCDHEMEWEDCGACGGDGYFDGYEEDPNWYQPGDMVTCSQCAGTGGDYWCISNDCPTYTANLIHPEKPHMEGRK